MAQNAVIGSLRIDLGLNSASFTTGLKTAQKSLGTFGKTAAVGFAAVTTAAVAAAAAFAPMIKASIDYADAIDEAAQKTGVAAEALSRLNYAAKIEGVGLDGLTAGLVKLSRSMADVAGGKGPAAAFKALGIAVTDSAGNLRSSETVFADVADRFSRIEDGSTKAALAVQIFGKSGADLIPLLNYGADGLRRAADESDRFGQTISGKTAAAAGQFNDTLTRIGQIMGGVVNKITEKALPALQRLADLLASPEFAQAAQTLAQNVVGALTIIADAITGVTNALSDLSGKISDGLNRAFAPPAQRSSEQIKKDIADYERMLSGGGFLQNRPNVERLLAASKDELANRSAGSGLSVSPSTFNFRKALDGGGATTGGPIDLSKFFSGLNSAATAQKALNAELEVMNNSLALQREEWENLQEPIRAAGDAIANVMGGLVSDLFSGRDAIGGLINSFKQLGQQLIQMALNQMITGLLSSLFGGGGFGVGKGLTGAATFGFSGNGFYGIPGYEPRASGGPVNAGSLYMVGEEGPEMFIPNSSGTIVPNGALRGGETVVRVELGQGLVGQIIKQTAANTSVQIKTEAPAAVAKSNIDNRRG